MQRSKKSATSNSNSSSSTSVTGLFGTLRNSFRRRSSSSSGKLNTVSPKREPTLEAFPIVNQSQNGKVQPKSNYSSSNKNGVNITDSVPENPSKINYPNSDVITATLEKAKLASDTAGTDCKESNLGEIKKHQEASKELKEEQTSVTGSNEINSPLPVLNASQADANNYLKNKSDNDVSADAEMFRFLSNGIYSNLAILSAMSRQGSVNSPPLISAGAATHLPQPHSLQTNEPIYSNSSTMAPTYDIANIESPNAIYNNIAPSNSSCTPPASPLSSADQSSTTCPMSTSSLSLKSFSSSSESSQSSLKPSNPMMLLIKQHLQTKYPEYSIINQNDLQVLNAIFVF